MKQMVGLQMSIFGSFESIGADPGLASELIPYYDNRFIPSVVQMSEFDAANSAVKNISRLSMVTPDGKITIVFLPNRIDCNYNPKGERVAPEKIEQISVDMCQLLEKTVKYFGLVGNRLAINGQFVTDELSLHYSDYMVKRDFYGEAELNEWTVRSNTSLDLTILEKSEPANNILNIELGKDSQGSAIIIVTFDINTVPGNSIMRFGSDSLAPFLEQATKNMKNMLSDLR